jgi:hypothetical protein
VQPINDDSLGAPYWETSLNTQEFSSIRLSTQGINDALSTFGRMMMMIEVVLNVSVF